MASFSPISPAQCCFASSKKYWKKSRHHCRDTETGEAGGEVSSLGVERLFTEIVAPVVQEIGSLFPADKNVHVLY